MFFRLIQLIAYLLKWFYNFFFQNHETESHINKVAVTMCHSKCHKSIFDFEKVTLNWKSLLAWNFITWLIWLTNVKSKYNFETENFKLNWETFLFA